MLNFSDVALRRGPRLLISGATFNLFRGEKIGLTGVNGSGKSSLLAMMRGELQPDAGTFEKPANLVIGYVAQELPATDRQAIEFVLDGDAELRTVEAGIRQAEAHDDGIKVAEQHGHYAAIGGYDARSRAARLLHGLGFSSADETRPVTDFSGGWRVRLNLAQALMCRCDLMLLDEPTNHLDLDAIVWLENWLREFPGTLLLISHDREFLDRIVNRIVNIEQGTARVYTGNYSEFETQRVEQLSQQQTLYERQQREIAHMMSFVERFRAKASKATQAQSRLKALERMQRIAPAHVDSPFEFSLKAPEKLPRPLLAIDGQSVGYGDRLILQKVSLTLSPGDRVALLGRNGAGKSTLMKLLAGELVASSGKRVEARDLKVGYFAQHQMEQLHPRESPLEHLRDLSKQRDDKATEQDLRNFLAGFGFQGDRVFEPVAPFSGGEKARLVLSLVSYQRPNLLLLDEPTNHLDLEMRQALTVALQEYEGAVVVVSHDRHLLRTVADELYRVSDGRAQLFEGDLDDYARMQEGEASGKAVTAPSNTRVQGADAKRQRKREEAGRRQRLSGLKAEAGRLEQLLARLQGDLANNEAELADPALYAQDAKLELKKRLEAGRQLAAQIAQTEDAWLVAAERYEAAIAAEESPIEDVARLSRRFTTRRVVVAGILLLCIATGAWQTGKPMPQGTDIDSGDVGIPADAITFLHDLTFQDAAGVTIHEQQIFDAVFAIVDQAQTVLVLDFFLFNDQAGKATGSHRALSRELTDHLLARKRARSELRVVLVTDPINDVYGGAPSPLLQELAAAGIDVVSTDLVRLRDSNPGYSSLWRIFVQWWGNSPATGWLPDPFSDVASRISLRSWLTLLNFKANHRKVVVADRVDGTWVGLVTSANPHDASSGHSNVAFRFTGALTGHALASELGVARFSGWPGELPAPPTDGQTASPTSRAVFVSEEAIRRRLLAAINESNDQDAIAIAMFYLADRSIIEALLAAANRGTKIRLILDPNKDAFGIEKDGVPNRPVAHELLEASKGAISVRWYRTHGEQFHSKLVMITRPQVVIASLGSANLTRRNIGNYNLEANIQVEVPRTEPLASELQAYFERLWNNERGIEHTLPYSAYRDDSRVRYWRYRLMEATGLSTF